MSRDEPLVVRIERLHERAAEARRKAAQASAAAESRREELHQIQTRLREDHNIETWPEAQLKMEQFEKEAEEALASAEAALNKMGF